MKTTDESVAKWIMSVKSKGKMDINQMKDLLDSFQKKELKSTVQVSQRDNLSVENNCGKKRSWREGLRRGSEKGMEKKLEDFTKNMKMNSKYRISHT